MSHPVNHAINKNLSLRMKKSRSAARPAVSGNATAASGVCLRHMDALANDYVGGGRWPGRAGSVTDR
jgi:hypothetical protein